jgi:hypothetical protein
MHPVKAVSSVVAISGLDRSNDSESSLESIRVWMCESEALTTVISDEIDIMFLGASWYLQDRS